MPDNVINLGLNLDDNQFNSQVDRTGEKLRSAYEGLLPADDIAKLEAILDKFQQTKNSGGLRNEGTAFFSDLSSRQEESHNIAIDAVKKKYDSERDRVKKDTSLSDVERQIKMKRLDSDEERATGAHGGIKKEIDEIEKLFGKYLSSVKRALNEEQKKGRGGGGGEDDDPGDPHQKARRGANKFSSNFNRLFGTSDGGDAASSGIRSLAGGLTEEGGLLSKLSPLLTSVVSISATLAAAFIYYGNTEARADKKLKSTVDNALITGSGSNLSYRGFIGGTSAFANLGYDADDARKMILGTARGRGYAVGEGETSADFRKMVESKAFLKRGYGLEDDDVNAFDKFNRLEKGGNSVNQIVDFLTRNEKNGILGVSKGDFSGLPQAIKNTEQILNFQRGKGDGVNSDLAQRLEIAGAQIGGTFAGETGGQTMSTLLNGLTSPKSDAFKAMDLMAARKANPNATTFELQAMLEGGSNMNAIMNQMDQVEGVVKGKGSREMKERFLSARFGLNKQQTVSLLDNFDILQEQLKSAVSPEDKEKIMKNTIVRADTAVTTLDKFWTQLKGSLGDISSILIQIGNNTSDKPIDLTKHYGMGDSIGTTGNAVDALKDNAAKQKNNEKARGNKEVLKW